ncbi:MAG: hypothetical protein IJ120_09525 [Solobacterium sp.]|nr:hypothetical protein [Solobacterium sp.]
MKKAYAIAMTGLMLTLTGCGAPKEVPDSLALSTMQKILSSDKTITLGEHTPDKDLHRDTVTFKTEKQVDYGTVRQYGDVTFEYMRANDIWRAVDYSLSDDIDIYEPEAFIGEYEGEAYALYDNYLYTFRITDIDFENMTVTLEGKADQMRKHMIEEDEYLGTVDISGVYPLHPLNLNSGRHDISASTTAANGGYAADINNLLAVQISIYSGVKLKAMVG